MIEFEIEIVFACFGTDQIIFRIQNVPMICCGIISNWLNLLKNFDSKFTFDPNSSVKIHSKYDKYIEHWYAVPGLKFNFDVFE